MTWFILVLLMVVVKYAIGMYSPKRKANADVIDHITLNNALRRAEGKPLLKLQSLDKKR